MTEAGATIATMSSEPKRATYQDVLDAPEHTVAELIDGALYTHARPRLRHAISSSRLGAVLAADLDAKIGRVGGWIVLDEPELHLGGDVLVPDLAAWRIERFPEDGDEVGIAVSPDWVCEVLSPSTTTHDRLRKLPKYATAGVAWVWLVDPIARTLEVYRRADPLWHLVAIHDDAKDVTCEPFDGVLLPLRKLW